MQKIDREWEEALGKATDEALRKARATAEDLQGLRHKAKPPAA
jgi:hypothetical protein